MGGRQGGDRECSRGRRGQGRRGGGGGDGCHRKEGCFKLPCSARARNNHGAVGTSDSPGHPWAQVLRATTHSMTADKRTPHSTDQQTKHYTRGDEARTSLPVLGERVEAEGVSLGLADDWSVAVYILPLSELAATTTACRARRLRSSSAAPARTAAGVREKGDTGQCVHGVRKGGGGCDYGGFSSSACACCSKPLGKRSPRGTAPYPVLRPLQQPHRLPPREHPRYIPNHPADPATSQPALGPDPAAAHHISSQHSQHGMW